MHGLDVKMFGRMRPLLINVTRSRDEGENFLSNRNGYPTPTHTKEIEFFLRWNNKKRAMKKSTAIFLVTQTHPKDLFV